MKLVKNLETKLLLLKLKIHLLVDITILKAKMYERLSKLSCS